MRGPVISRRRIATAVAMLSSAGIISVVGSSPAANAGGLTLAPDLLTLPITGGDLVVDRRDDKVLLRLSNEIANVGAGPLEVFPGELSANCDGDGDPANDRDASQRVYADTDGDGAFTRDIDGVESERRFGCMRYHRPHDHWHVLDFAAYELRREPRPGHPGSGGKLVAGSRKVGFCVVDTLRPFPGPQSPSTPAYPIDPGGAGCDSGSTQGLSVGWADVYAFALPGQQLDVTGLPRGRYCLISQADPTDLLAERDESNNVRRARILLRPGKASVRRLRGPCRG